MTAKKDITLEEFVEKYIPCWDMIRYNLTSRKLFNRIKPYISIKNFGYTAEEWLEAWNQWKNEEDTCINGWIEEGKAPPKYRILRDLCQPKPCVSFKDSEVLQTTSMQRYESDVSKEIEESNERYKSSIRIKPYVPKNFGHTLAEQIEAENRWENEKDLYPPKPYVSLRDLENSKVFYFWTEFSYVLGEVPKETEESNIVWDVSEYVSCYSACRIYREILKSHPNTPKLKIWYHPVASDDHGIYFEELCLRSDVEKLCENFELDPSSIEPELVPYYCKKCTICSANQEVKTTKTIKEQKSVKAATKIKKKSSLEKIQSFLDSKSKTNPMDSFSTADISKELSLPSYSCTVQVRELLQKGKVKIVDFKNGNRPYPVYQSIKGSLPSKEVVTEGSLSPDLISVTEYCKVNDLKPVFIKDILQEAENQGIEGYYTYSSDKGTGGPRGYFYKYKKIDLDRIINQTLKDKELPTSMVEPVLFPESQEQKLFKPKNLFKKVLSFFGYKFNFSITVTKKKTVANTGQDLIDF